MQSLLLSRFIYSAVSFAVMTYWHVSLDINECLQNPCHTDGFCENNAGSYRCTCNTGYSGDGRTCSGKKI